ncbi:hypothetical protein B0H10DRAFT_2197826 [Mycena sp. CBHHK59/15]|nr:hypothetical protein B0H10DRAFT_2197826 [Mycena sp. CBHHK59/15]
MQCVLSLCRLLISTQLPPALFRRKHLKRREGVLDNAASRATRPGQDPLEYHVQLPPDRRVPDRESPQSRKTCRNRPSTDPFTTDPTNHEAPRPFAPLHKPRTLDAHSTRAKQQAAARTSPTPSRSDAPQLGPDSDDDLVDDSLQKQRQYQPWTYTHNSPRSSPAVHPAAHLAVYTETHPATHTPPALAREKYGRRPACTLCLFRQGDIHGFWDTPVIAMERYLANVSAKQKTEILKRPGGYAVFILFNGGLPFFHLYPNAPADLARKLSGVANSDELSIGRLLPVPENHDRGNRYAPPFILIGEVSSPAIRDKIIRHSTYAISPDLAVHAVRIDPDLLSPDAIGNRLRWAACAAMFHDPELRLLFDRTSQAAGNATLDERLFEKLATAEVRHMPREATPACLLTMRPCATNSHRWAEVTKLGRSLELVFDTRTRILGAKNGKAQNNRGGARGRGGHTGSSSGRGYQGRGNRGRGQDPTRLGEDHIPVVNRQMHAGSDNVLPNGSVGGRIVFG